MEKPRIIYVFDALCGWCYGFSPVIMAIYEEYSDRFAFEVISGGMILGNRVGPIGVVAPFIESSYGTIEETTGIRFGDGFLRNAEKGELILDSEKPAIALAVLRSREPEKAIIFAHEIQTAIKFEGRDPNHHEIYRHIAVNHGYDPDQIQHQLHEEAFKQAAYYDFALARQLRVESYPAAFMQVGDLEFYMIAKGYTDYDTLKLRIEKVIREKGLNAGGI
jgi:putative protein-disulfide isomerase